MCIEETEAIPSWLTCSVLWPVHGDMFSSATDIQIYAFDMGELEISVHAIHHSIFFGGMGLVVLKPEYFGITMASQTSDTGSQNTVSISDYQIRRLIVRSCKISKPKDLYLELNDRSEIWQAPRQQACKCACLISKRCDDFDYQSCGFETSRDVTRHLVGYWNGALVFRYARWTLCSMGKDLKYLRHHGNLIEIRNC